MVLKISPIDNDADFSFDDMEEIKLKSVENNYAELNLKDNVENVMQKQSDTVVLSENK